MGRRVFPDAELRHDEAAIASIRTSLTDDIKALAIAAPVNLVDDLKKLKEGDPSLSPAKREQQFRNRVRARDRSRAPSRSGPSSFDNGV